MSGGFHRAGELARLRLDRGIAGDVNCQIWFGVSEATIARVEQGEIHPTDELAAKITRFLAIGDELPKAAPAHGVASLGGGTGNCPVPPFPNVEQRP